MEIYFNDEQITIPGKVKVEDFKESILPERENFEISVPGKHGSYFAGFRYLPKQFEFVLMLDNEGNDIDELIREMAWMLDIAEPSPLRISTKPGIVWYATVDGLQEVERTNFNKEGQVAITFRMYDPFGYSETTKAVTPVGKLLTFDNQGTAPALPKFTFDFTNDCGFISLVSPNGTIQVGKRNELDVVSLPASQQLYVGVTTLSGWTINDGVIPLTGAYFGGDVVTAGGLQAGGYGNQANAWHGPTIKRTLSSPASHWDVKASLGFSAGGSNYAEEKGRIDFMLLDEANAIIGRISLIDSSGGYSYTVPEFWFGGKRVWSETSNIPAPKTVKQYNKTKKKWESKTVTQKEMGDWNGFDGVVSMRYLDNKITFEIENSGKRVKVHTVQNANKLIGTRKLASICVWYGQYGTETPIEKSVLKKLNIKKHNVQRFVDIPNQFQQGDQLEIDCSNQSVRLNDKLFLEGLDIGSTLFDIEEGETKVQIFSSKGAVVNASAEFVERFI